MGVYVKKAMKTFCLIFTLAVVLVSCDLRPKATVGGYVYDSSTDQKVAGVVVTASTTTRQTISDANGYFSLEVPEGEVTFRFVKAGMDFYDITIFVEKDMELYEDVVGYPPIKDGQYRFVLTWGPDPSDLDSHLLIPGTNDEIYFADQDTPDASANLDWDVVTGYGPETTTITTELSGTYYYSIYNYSQSGNFLNSEAVVKVYNSSGLWKTYAASSVVGDGTSDWWRVCSLNGDTITPINTFNDTAGAGWAGIE